jgi:DNA-binding response OmpR family regulator
MGKKNFDFYLFDIMLPQEEGYDLATEVRKKQKLAPILFLTALHDIDHKLKAFDTDADDYLTKPFEFRELLARIESLLRRVDLSSATPNESIDLGELNLDLVSYNLTIGSGKYPLKPITGKVLQILMTHVNKVVPKYMILEYVWNEDTKRTHANLDVQIHYIRKILEGSRDYSLETVRGVGIKLASLTKS